MQADVIGELDDEDAEAILAEMEPEDAADVRRLVEYEDDTAGGLMVGGGVLPCRTGTVGAVSARPRHRRRRFRALSRPAPVRHRRGRAADRRRVAAQSADVTTSAKADRHHGEAAGGAADATARPAAGPLRRAPFLGLPVVEEDGRLVGVVSRSAVDGALLDRSESESLRRQGVVGDELRSMPLAPAVAPPSCVAVGQHRAQHYRRERDLGYEETLAAVIAIASSCRWSRT